LRLYFEDIRERYNLKVIHIYKKEFDLIKKACANNREAQYQLFIKYSPKMLSICRQYIKDIHYAEEVMLNGFLKVFTHLKAYEAKGSFEGWIRRIMINESISFLRKRKRWVFVEDESYFTETVSNHYETQNNVSELQHLVDNLHDDLRIVFNLYVVEGYKHKEIAKLLHITESASRIRFFRARKQLQAQYVRLKKLKNEK